MHLSEHIFYTLFDQKVPSTGELKKETIPIQFCTQMRSLKAQSGIENRKAPAIS
jgi:hypothetical protein